MRAIVTTAKVLSAAFQRVQSTVWRDLHDAMTDVLDATRMHAAQVGAPSLSPHTRAVRIGDCRVWMISAPGSHAAIQVRHPLPSIEPSVPE